jgi:tRNA1(Val) A37 N6-methylase TrmN6
MQTSLIRQSISQHMSDYIQPDFYRFNQDSLALVERAHKVQPNAKSVLDLGAGCGIMGLELARRLDRCHLALVELQSDFAPYLKSNMNNFLPPSCEGEIFIEGFESFNSERRFDLIVCNPPYYLPNEGEASKDKRRNLCRSFVVDDWAKLLKCISHHLSETGSAHLVLKKGIKVDLSNFRSTSHFCGGLWFIDLFRLNVD